MAGTTSAAGERTARLVFWLPPEEAARIFGVERAELTRRVRAGQVQMRAKVAGGELLATLCSTDLVRCFGEPSAEKAREAAAAAAKLDAPRFANNPFGKPADSNRPYSLGRVPEVQPKVEAPPEPATPSEPQAPARLTEAEDEERHGRLVAAEERVRVLELYNARLEGRLENADRIERGLQRYADKLEVKLEEAETLRLNLARAVGQLEAEVARLQGRLEVAEADRPRLIEAPRRERGPRESKRGWFRRKR